MDEWWSEETQVAVAVTNDAEDGTTVVGSTWDATMTVGSEGDEVTVDFLDGPSVNMLCDSADNVAHWGTPSTGSDDTVTDCVLMDTAVEGVAVCWLCSGDSAGL